MSARAEKLGIYRGGQKSVAVYNTYADNRRLHFDVFVPTRERNIGNVDTDIDAQAVEYAKEFLALIGETGKNVEVSLCERCHIDDTEAYRDQLWQLPNKEIYIWPLEGCPKPR